MLENVPDILSKVFRSFDAFDAPFSPDNPARLIIYPTDGYILTYRQYVALGEAVKVAGFGVDALCVITEGCDIANAPSSNDVFPVQLDSFAKYKHLQDEGLVLQENAIVSPAGDWGVLISQEFHAVLGGTVEFVAAFKKCYPSWLNDIDEFKKRWLDERTRGVADISWMPALLSHVECLA